MMSRLRPALLLSILCLLALAADAPPVSPLRRDAAFWRMLTPAGHDVLSDVTIRYAPTCEGIARAEIGGRYDSIPNTITLCGAAAAFFPADILRHEALHALDWADGEPFYGGKGIPPKLIAAAEAEYPGWLRPVELYAVIPLVVDWDLAALPDDVAALYAPWFEEASR